MTRSTVRLPVVVAAVALFAAACGSSGSSSIEAAPAADESAATAAQASGDDVTSTEDTESTSEPAAEAATTEVSAAEESPLAQFFGFGGDPAEQQARYEEQEREAQQSIRACMAEQGFEYIPVDYSQFAAFGGEDFDQDSYREKYGYGFSTQFLEGPEQAFEEEQAFVDPNQEIVEAMSEGERDAYELALYGEPPEFDPTIDPESDGFDDFEGFEPQGCSGEAYQAIFDPFSNEDGQNLMQDLEPKLEELYQRIEADPRIADILAGWSECMADAGFTFTNPDEIFEELDERMQPFYSEQSFPGQDIPEEELEAMSEEELESLFSRGPQLSPELEAQLVEVQEFELAVAAADHECQGDRESVYAEVSREYELNFIEENQDALDKLQTAQNN